jgi:hypothetical protein
MTCSNRGLRFERKFSVPVDQPKATRRGNKPGCDTKVALTCVEKLWPMGRALWDLRYKFGALT